MILGVMTVLEGIKYVPAAHYRAASRGAGDIWWIVIHDMEIAEKGDTAESCANMFHTTTREASAHLCIDNNSIVRSVKDKDVAWHAPGANSRGIGLEHAGFASQTRTQWIDAYGVNLLTLSAKAAAALAVKYSIPVVRRSAVDLRAGKHGFCSHADVSEAWHLTTHTDPGKNFPWDVYLKMVSAEVAAIKGKPWTKAALAAAAAALGVSVAVFSGITAAPTPAPSPTPTATATASPTGSPTTPTPATSTPTPKPTTTTTKPVAKPVLRVAYPGYYIHVGQTNSPNVERVQRRLKALGLYSGAIDGDFGSMTKASVIKFQKKHWPKTKANWDGIVGKATWVALFTY